MLFLFSFLSFSFLTSHSHSSDKATVPIPDKNTAVVGTLKANTVFFPSCAFLFLPNAVYRDSVTNIVYTNIGRTRRYNSVPTILTAETIA